MVKDEKPQRSTGPLPPLLVVKVSLSLFIMVARPDRQTVSQEGGARRHRAWGPQVR